MPASRPRGRRRCSSPLSSPPLPTFWQVSTEAEFLRGEVENLSIDTYGRLTLGPTSTPVYESSAPFLWTWSTAPDGSVYAGSGNEGQVYRVDAAGKGSVFFDAEELEVHAIAPAPGGGIYVGTSPDGKIYKVDASGKGDVFFDPPDRYIWSLAVDRAGNVFAATGDKGVIYKITPDGKGASFYETKATHAMTLAFDREGRLLGGHRIAGPRVPDRRHRQAVRPARLAATTRSARCASTRTERSTRLRVSGRRGRRAAPPPPPEPPTPAPQPIVVGLDRGHGHRRGRRRRGSAASTPAAAAPTRDRRPARSIRIAPDGAWDLVWESREDTPYDIAFETGGGNLLVATGNKGKIYRLAGDPFQPTLVARANAQQVTAHAARPRRGAMLFATSNPGKVFRLSPTRAERGTYTSDVRDAQTVAAWGAIKWQAQAPAGTRVEISTRSGNTRTPDETWSDWSAVLHQRRGQRHHQPARPLPAVAGGADRRRRSEAPLLTSVTAAYLPRNMRPRVTSITIHPPGRCFSVPSRPIPEIAGFDGDTPDRRAAAQVAAAGAAQELAEPRPPRLSEGLLTFVWRAEDDNRDELSYDVLYRREGETAWKSLKRDVSDAILVWDTTSVPNGRYVLRVVASDAPSNSPPTALTGAMESTAFEIDNAPPEITVTAVRREGARLMIAFDVRDEHSAVQKAEYSLDGDRWQTIYPKDGIADSRVEQFELVLEGEAAARGVIIRAADALNNMASARGEAPPPASGRR